MAELSRRLHRHCLRKSQILLFLVLWPLCACQPSSPSVDLPSQTPGSRLVGVNVERVKDGDSFAAEYRGRKVEVRLFGIDAPEREQPHARKSRAIAQELLEGQTLELVIKDTDRYGRLVAEAYVAGSVDSVNLQLVQKGAAWVYRRYSEDATLLAAERTASRERRGLWRLPQEQRMAPWLWRNNNRKDQ